MKAIQAGFTSVMLDGSELPYEENVRLTKEVTDLAHMVGVSVEGEIGTIGVMSNSDEGGVENVTYTNPEDVIDFVTKTGVDCLAIAIGTAHGIYPKGFVPKLQLELLERIKEVAPVPLVLHGGSNNPDDEIRRACQIGIRKVNISSDFKYAFFKKVDEVIQETGGFVPAKVLTPGINDAKTGDPGENGVIWIFGKGRIIQIRTGRNMINFEFSNTTEIVFGKGTQEQVGEKIRKYSDCNKVLVVYGSDRIKKNGLFDAVSSSLKQQKIDILELGGVKPNPRLSLVRRGIEICRNEKIDFILAIGGGSAIDTAKAIGVGVPYEGDVWDFIW